MVAYNELRRSPSGDYIEPADEFITGAVNVGAGAGWFAGVALQVLQFKTITAGPLIEVVSSATEIEVAKLAMFAKVFLNQPSTTTVVIGTIGNWEAFPTVVGRYVGTMVGDFTFSADTGVVTYTGTETQWCAVHFDTMCRPDVAAAVTRLEGTISINGARIGTGVDPDDTGGSDFVNANDEGSFSWTTAALMATGDTVQPIMRNETTTEDIDVISYCFSVIALGRAP